MANIVEYNNQPGQTVRADESAASVAANAAGAHHRMARDVGESLRHGITSLGTPVQEVANEYERHQTFQQISHGAASYSSLYGDLTQQWNKLASQSDPNDTSVMQGFREHVLGPSLEKFNQSFDGATPGAQKWALERSTALQSHFADKMTADMGVRAGVAVKQNLGDIERNYSNIVQRDPTALDHIVESLNTDVGAMLDASPTMTAVEAARVKGELVPKITERIAQSALYGRAKDDPQGAINAINAGEYDKFLDAKEKVQAVKFAEGVQAAKRVQDNHDYEIAQRKKREAQETAATGYVNKILNGETLTGKNIAADLTLSAGQREGLVRFQNSYTQQLKEKKENTPHPDNYREILTDMFNTAQNDPNNLHRSLQRIRDSFTAGNLNPQEEAILEQRFANMDKPLERNFHNQVTVMQGAVKNSIVAKAYGSVDPNWTASTVNRIEYDAYQKLNAARAKQEDLNPLLDPNSPKYLFSKQVVDSYLVPPKAAVAAGADKERKAGQSAADKIAPAVGTVKDGFRFTGGNPPNPADPAQWEKL